MNFQATETWRRCKYLSLSEKASLEMLRTVYDSNSEILEKTKLWNKVILFPASRFPTPGVHFPQFSPLLCPDSPDLSEEKKVRRRKLAGKGQGAHHVCSLQPLARSWGKLLVSELPLTSYTIAAELHGWENH